MLRKTATGIHENAYTLAETLSIELRYYQPVRHEGGQEYFVPLERSLSEGCIFYQVIPVDSNNSPAWFLV
jgi:hypothetical protein